METLQYTYLDKSEFGPGPWDNEPDKVQWPDRQTGLPCLAVRHQTLGNWCGYVGVAESHPYFRKDYDDELVDIKAHGGLTFSGLCAHDDKEHGICHNPAPGEPDRVWWFGFDCAHAYDYAPGLATTIKWHEDVYRDLAYVQRECASIARQLKARAP